VQGRAEHPRADPERRAQQAGGQTPFAVVVSCADSRVPPELVFDQGIGDLFVARVAGNTVADPSVLGSVEYAVAYFHCPLVVVLGHEACGAVTAAVDVVTNGVRLDGALPELVAPILPSVEAVRDALGDVVDAAVRENVRRTAAELRTGNSPVTAAVRAGDVAVVGAYYGLRTGRVDFIDGA
jgi:carbonic anhydrase